MNTSFKYLLIFLALCISSATAFGDDKTVKTAVVTLSIDKLRDKIKGGWAGQTIGVTFGGPYEFKYNGTFIQDYQPLLWYEGYVRTTMLNSPGLYDDLYMDLTFVDIFERLGLDAPVDSFAHAFANAKYMLWHANQAARYNILKGMKSPESGHWLNNPHADDIDYQIEADYAGLMSPGMPNTASEISDKIGHIMSYGDGWYGGVYIGAMYSLAFVSDDINYVVNEALRTIPEQSNFYKCIADVIRWHKEYPDDWHQTWLQLQKKWSSDIACPDGVFTAFNIDATINSAYVVMGLLYGNGDYGKTLAISTRAGQDADCNPSSAGGILGTMLGYSKIPSHWIKGLKNAENIDFAYTTISLNRVYDIGLKHALENIKAQGGNVWENQVTIPVQSPKAVRFERSFPNMYPMEKRWLKWQDSSEFLFEFTGSGFILTDPRKYIYDDSDYVYELEIYLDGKKMETVKMPTNFTTRKLDIFWKYPLENKRHTVRLKVLNPRGNFFSELECITYSDKPPVIKN